MGTSRSPSQFAGKIDRFAKSLGDTKPGLTAAAAAGKATFLAMGTGAVGVKPQGKRKTIGARYDLRGSGFKASAIVTYTGPAHLINNPTKPHYLAAKGLGSGRARKRGTNRMVERQDNAFKASAARFLGGSASGSFGGSNNRGARALTIGPNLRSYAFHPGTKGKGFAQKAKAAVAKQSPAIYTRAGITAPLKGVFR